MPRPEQSPSLPGYLQENETSEEFRDLIGSIPTEKGWVANHLHQYQGFWHTSRQLQGVLACQKHFQAHDGDIFLVTTPKSGSTWLKAVMFALVNRVSFPDPKQHPLLTDNPHALVNTLAKSILTSPTSPFRGCFQPICHSCHFPNLC
ncbi:CYTOSOLIC SULFOTRANSFERASE 12-RELATED, partial [Salix purpurea]